MIEIRRARLADIPFIRQLSLDTLAIGIPECRDIPNATVLANATSHLDDLEGLLQRRREAAILVASDDALPGGKPVGFLILEFNYIEDSTGEAQSYIYNMAVIPEYWGRYVGHQLVREAARLSHQRGFQYMTSRVTASNRRTLLAALRMGFEVERYQLTMACGPEGPAPMPGRPPDERGHALSRLIKPRRRKEPSP